MNSNRLKYALLLLPLVLSGCLTVSGGPPLVGGLPPTPTVVKGMAGGLAGTRVGRNLSSGDLRFALEAEYKALEYTPAGRSVTWQGADASGQVVPGQPYRVGSQDCRQYSQTILARGGSQTARGTACRNTDGSWQPLD